MVVRGGRRDGPLLTKGIDRQTDITLYESRAAISDSWQTLEICKLLTYSSHSGYCVKIAHEQRKQGDQFWQVSEDCLLSICLCTSKKNWAVWRLSQVSSLRAFQHNERHEPRSPFSWVWTRNHIFLPPGGKRCRTVLVPSTEGLLKAVQNYNHWWIPTLWRNNCTATTYMYTNADHWSTDQRGSPSWITFNNKLQQRNTKHRNIYRVRLSTIHWNVIWLCHLYCIWQYK